MAAGGGGPGVVTLTPQFKWVFIVVVVLTIAAAVGDVIVSFRLAGVQGTMPVALEDLANKLGSAWQLGFGAIVGLLGGKTL